MQIPTVAPTTAFKTQLMLTLAFISVVGVSLKVHAAEPDEDSPEAAIVAEEPTPVPNSKGLEESALSNPANNGQYKRPLLFAPEDNGLKPESPQIKWVFDRSGNKVLMGGLRLDAEKIGVYIDQIPRSSAPSELVEDSKGPNLLTTISFSWPAVLTKSGVATLEDKNGKAVWSQEFTEDMIPKWRARKAKFKAELRAHEASTWGLSDLSSVGLRALQSEQTLRACLTNQKSPLEHVKVCSTPFVTKKNGSRLSLAFQSPNQQPTVTLESKALGDTGLLNAPVGVRLPLVVNFRNGASVEIASQPVQLDLLDVVESKDGREIILTGRGTMPLGKKKVVSRPATHFWAPTGIQQDTIWQVALPKEAPTIRVLGTFNLPYTYLFRYSTLPKESDRVYVSERSSTGSFSSSPIVKGFIQQKGPLTSSEESVARTSKNEFEWTFAAPEKGAYNRARLSVPSSDKSNTKWVAHHTLYHGYPFEASARLTAVLTSTGQNVFLGELAGSAWFQSLGFTQNDLISRQRWGIAARALQSLTSIQVGDGTTIDNFSTWNVDLKYNLIRGVWNRDELFGLIASYQNVTFSDMGANLGGFGAYWARTMPRVFADLFELVPILDYSKYVDVEFIYYPMSMTTGVQAGSSYNLNFHGKVFWTKRLYGEAGFGIKQFEFSVPGKSGVAFSTAYGTLGVGFIF